jgi:hypothetical protein
MAFRRIGRRKVGELLHARGENMERYGYALECRPFLLLAQIDRLARRNDP